MQKVFNGNNIDLLKDYPDNYFDAVVTDPPYGLGKEPNATELMKDWIEHGYHEIFGSGFMGKEWDAFVPQPIFWKEVFRVLKPGGHVLSFFGTRTYDWGVMSMRFAGFEVRDCIQWLYGSGFPKSHNISKALDKINGRKNDFHKPIADYIKLKREELKLTQNDIAKHFPSKNGNATGCVWNWENWIAPTKKDWIKLKELLLLDDRFDKEIDRIEAEREVIGIDGRTANESIFNIGVQDKWDITAPSTDAAKQWDGWGTALKPANEPIVLARKPLEKGLSVAENILKWGVGGINIDASRIACETRTTPVFSNDTKTDNTTFTLNSNIQHERVETNQGRFPANIILTHHEDCECIGTKKVKSDGHHSGKVPNNGGLYNLGLKPLEDKGNIHAKNGQEEVENWDCHEDCPIRILDEQSGDRSCTRIGNDNILKKGKNNIMFGGVNQKKENTSHHFRDKGGASRFFYVAKASKSERNKGLEDFEEKIMEGRDEGQDERSVAFKARPTPMANIHPTVKPIKLMQYLVKMITPPNGIVLDPFCGSGTTGVACKIDGFQFIGLEQDPEYTKIAEARINNYIDKEQSNTKEKDQLTLF